MGVFALFYRIPSKIERIIFGHHVLRWFWLSEVDSWNWERFWQTSFSRYFGRRFTIKRQSNWFNFYSRLQQSFIQVITYFHDYIQYIIIYYIISNQLFFHSCFLMTQNLFAKGTKFNARNLNINSDYTVFFASLADGLTVKTKAIVYR